MSELNIVCLDLEGVLVPEIWIAFSEASGIPELRRTTRDEPDYDKLMRWRLGILREHGLGLKDIQATIRKIDPLPGAKDFLDALEEKTGVPMPENLRGLKERPVLHRDVTAPADMLEYVKAKKAERRWA